MVASIAKAAGDSNYYSTDGYYLEGSDEMLDSMVWHGKGAEQLGLIGEIDPKDYQSVMEGYVRGTEQRLGRMRDGVHQHRTGTDITFSAPKSVSLAAYIRGDDRVLDAHHKAVEKTLNYIEKNLLKSRAKDVKTGEFGLVDNQKMVAATFRHEASRNLDPQLHTHAVLANMVQGEDGKWRTMENRSLYDNIKLISAFYHNELAANLEGLGYGIEKSGRNGIFELTDGKGKPLYSKEVLEGFSTRSAEIKAAMRDLGYDMGDPVLRQKATLKTRAQKEHPDWQALREHWKEQAKSLGIDMNLEKERPTAPTDKPRTASEITAIALEAVEWATRHLEERESTFWRNDLTEIAIARSPGKGDIDAIEKAISTLISEGRLVNLKHSDGFTTDKALVAERENIHRLEGGQGASRQIVSQEVVERHLSQINLTDGQRQAIHTILNSRDRIVGVQGYAGSGKTTMLNTMREITEQERNTRIIGLAPSASAAKTLETESGIESRTLQSFLAQNSAITEGRAGTGLIDKLSEDVKGSIIVVDEASLAGTMQMRDLLHITDTLKPARLVLVGDSKQLEAVDAGKPFQQLQQAGMETAVMDQIMRQRDENLKAAVIEALSGDPLAALQRLDTSVVEAEGGMLAKTAAENWLSLSPEERENTGLMAPTHVIREKINEFIRDELSKDGILHGDKVNIDQLISARYTEAERELPGSYNHGQVVIFERAISSLNINAGDALSVIGRENSLVHLERDGETVKIDPAGGIAKNVDVYNVSDMELRAGDEIRWTRNDKELDLINTHQAEVTKIENGQITVLTEDGRDIVLDIHDPALQHSDYAFNATVHAFQGRTVDNVIAVLDSSHEELTNQKTFYVEISRAKESAMIITDNKEILAETLYYNTGEHNSALEGVGEHLKSEETLNEQMSMVIDDARQDIGIGLDEHESIHAEAPNDIYEDAYNYELRDPALADPEKELELDHDHEMEM